MSTENIPGCAEQRTATTLSAWRDGILDSSLDSSEAHHLEAHLAGCAACRARLAEYDDLADRLRAIPAPAPVGGYGRNPRLRSSSRRTWPRAFFPRSASQRLRVAGGLGAMAAVLLLALAFTQLFSGIRGAPTVRTSTPSATATGSSTPGVLGPLAWQARSPLPDGIRPNGMPSPSESPLFGTNFEVAPSDGTTAYACQLHPSPTGSNPPAPGTPIAARVWATHDDGRTWNPVLSIPAQPNVTVCTVNVDAHDPEVVVASSAYAFRTAPPSPDQSATNYVTFDGASTGSGCRGSN
jgi:hypothetical protein